MFQDSMSFEMEAVTFFHDYSMILVIFICFISSYFISSCLFNTSFDFYVSENHELEFFWTLMPSFILVLLAVPSMKVLYFSEEYYLPVFSFKVTVHHCKWYWSYENLGTFEDFDSFMENSFICRLLKVSNSLSLPVNCSVRSMITSGDVIHSWSLPSLGIKVDAIPGRLNQTFFGMSLSSVVVGQCSEICGANHSFMPIVLMFS